MTSPTNTFGRFNVPDLATQRAVQDIYNKLSQLQALITSVQQQIVAIQKQLNP